MGGPDGEVNTITIRERKPSLGESADDYNRKRNSLTKSNNRSQKTVSQYSTMDYEITEEGENATRLVLGACDFDSSGDFLQVTDKSDEILKRLIALAKQMAGSIDTKYKLKVQKKPALKEHLIACAALRKYFISGVCNEKKAPLNPLTKSIWKKWKEFSEESKRVSATKMKEILLEHAEQAMEIFETDTDFAPMMQKNDVLKDFKKLLEEFKTCLQEASTSSARPSFEHRPDQKTTPTISTPVITPPAPEDVNAFMNNFSIMQSEVTKSYLELMEALKLRWLNAGEQDDVIARENVAKKTREDLLSIQDQLIKYQNSLVMYQADINALWQCMLDHQHTMNNDFQWDFVEDVEDIGSATNGYPKKQKALHKRVGRFFTKKFGKSKKR